MHKNKLTHAQLERLSILMEECGEVTQIIGKIQRHGYSAHHPKERISNRGNLEKELGHVLNAIRMLTDNDLNSDFILESQAKKELTISRYTYYQGENS